MEPVRIGVVGVGNNISALLQGVQVYRNLEAAHGRDAEGLPGVTRCDIGGVRVTDVRISAAFDVAAQKVGLPLTEAVFAAPNNYPRIVEVLESQPVKVSPGARFDGVPEHLAALVPVDAHADRGIEGVVEELLDTRTEVLLYSLPTGSPQAARFYAECALRAGVALVNCTPDPLATDPAIAARFTAAGVPLVGDDLASHLGSSVVHRTLLQLVADRGLDVDRSYQVNLGGNADFKNLLVRGEAKRTSKHNALGDTSSDRVCVVPSGGYVPVLGDQKVGYVFVEALGWGGMPATLEVKLTVQDSSNAAGVIIDLVRLAALARRAGVGGPVHGAASLLKSPPPGDTDRSPDAFDRAAAELARRITGTPLPGEATAVGEAAVLGGSLG
ncbi:inositol-3-phosphate synthase [Kitasatospora nipponensis]